MPGGCPAPRGLGRTACVLAAAAILLAGAGCHDDGFRPDALRYGQLGSIHLVLDAPLRLGVGRLRQTLDWRSRGDWTLREAISYGGVAGDEDVRIAPGDPTLFAEFYL
ncbi:MAG TPA: hypothetical protein VJ997_03310, partial [Longimicrobiales bacterium]|nr:hypothetical protein [Longimicrobiales bacterium]